MAGFTWDGRRRFAWREHSGPVDAIRTSDHCIWSLSLFEWCDCLDAAIPDDYPDLRFDLILVLQAQGVIAAENIA